MATVLPPRTAVTVLADAIRAEISKLCSLPATWMTLGSTVALAVLLAILFVAQVAESRATSPDSLNVSMGGIAYAQAGLLVFGVLAACSEYVGGQIRITLIAIPQRALQRFAATIALVTFVLPTAMVTVFASVAVTALAAGDDAEFPASATVVGAIASATIYLVLMAIFSAAVGSMTRQALPTAGIIVLYFIAVSPLLRGVPSGAYLLPDLAGYTLWFTAPDAAPPAAVAWLIVIAWPAAAGLLSVVLVRRRDI